MRSPLDIYRLKACSVKNMDLVDAVFLQKGYRFIKTVGQMLRPVGIAAEDHLSTGFPNCAQQPGSRVGDRAQPPGHGPVVDFQIGAQL